MHELLTIYDYMRSYSQLLGERILDEYAALHSFHDQVSPRLKQLLRTPFAAQQIAIMGVVKRWQAARTALIVAECGTGKTLMALAAMHAHSRKPHYTALAMVPPHLVLKWAREAFLTIPGIRVFLVDGLRNGGEPNQPHGINEVRLVKGRVLRDGIRSSLSDLRMARFHTSARKRWSSVCSQPALFIVGRERAKLGYVWRHAFVIPRSGRYFGCAVNPDSGKPVMVGDERRLTAEDFLEAKIGEVVDRCGDQSRKQIHSALWQADETKIPRMAPVEFIGRYMPRWFDYAICDEIHQLAGDTAQGNALGTLASCTDRVLGLTGTLLGGYADDVFNTLFRLEAAKMKQRGYEWGASGRTAFVQDYGVLETVTKVEAIDNACSNARSTTSVHRKPGASPLLFGEFLMQLCAFVFLDDISSELPAYEEELVGVAMDDEMRVAYEELEQSIREALRKNRRNRSVLSTMLNALLVYPDHPFGIGTLYGVRFDAEARRKVKFVIAEPRDLAEDCQYSKERELVARVKKELAEGRRCQIFAVYTRKHDVNARLEKILKEAGIHTAVLRANVDTAKREAWYEKQIRQGVQAVIAHPRLVETGLDLLEFPTIIFYESGYSLHTLRQASRRSWRIGQRRPVRVIFLCYENTMQTACLRLMGKKLLVALTMEGKFAGEGLQNVDEDDDMLAAMARELVEKNGIGESADAVWRSLHAEHQKLFPATSDRKYDDSSAADQCDREGAALTQPVEGDLDSALIAVPDRQSVLLPWKRRRSRAAIPEQGSLFG